MREITLVILLVGVCLNRSLGAGVATQDESTQASTRSEYEIKSELIYHFIKFVEWPGHELVPPSALVVVGVVGDDCMFPVLKLALRDKTLYGHPIVVRRLDFGAGLKNCGVLFLGSSDRKELVRIVQMVGRSPVLTVGDNPQFCQWGGIIAFVRIGNRMQFAINPDAAARAGLQVSSRLLRLALVSRETRPRAGN
jgi:hypothetical protein